MANSTSTKKHLSATVYYLLAGIAIGWPGIFATGLLLPEWGTGAPFSPLSLATIHLLVLGFMLTVAFGVLYQIVPIAFQAPPIPRHVLYWHLPLHVISVIVTVAGFLLIRFDVVAIGGGLLVCSAVAYFVLIARSYIRARNKTSVHKALSVPFTSLWLVILVGMFQAMFPGRVNQSVLLTHVLLGGFAFWGGLVLVFTYKLVPMFAISHGYKASLPRSAVLYFIGILLLISATWLPGDGIQTVVTDAGGALVLIALLSYTVDIIAIVRARKRRRLVLPLYDAFLATLFFVLGQAGMIVAEIFHAQDWLYPSVYLFAFGGLVGLMFAYMQKMVPFLWYEYRFSKRPERKTSPLIDDMVPRGTAQSAMGLYFLGVIAGFVGVLLRGGHDATMFIDWSSAICLTLGSILLFGALRHVLTIGGPRPPDDTV
ncbi:MAG: hypothetical protein K6T83_03455 [Alicyclobacillus sp.]|nr:hypothetical protein [Alicyclobacillus sp.]